MKKVLPMSENLAPVKHMIAASVGEVVRNHSTSCLEVPFTRGSRLGCLISGCVFNSGSNGGHQDSNADIYLWRAWTVVICSSETGAGQ
jgi:hypothetical protein